MEYALLWWIYVCSKPNLRVYVAYNYYSALPSLLLKKQIFLKIFVILFKYRNVVGSSGVLEFALIYDELNSLLLVNILQAKVTIPLNSFIYSYP
jgi:hypothetical protein